jgi:hypothetical protein
MFRRIATCIAFALCFGWSYRPALAQEVIHALTGTVSSVDAKAKTITLFLDGGDLNVFNDMTNTKASSSVDKKLLVASTNPDDVKKKGAYVVIFYYSDGKTRTALALRSLGPGPFTAETGTVSDFKERRSISIADKTGAVETFMLSPGTVAEGGYGAVNGVKFQAEKGDHVRVVGETQNGESVALFVTQTM